MMENNCFDQGYLAFAARLAKEDLDRSHPEAASELPMLVWHCKALKNRKYVFGTPKARIIHEVTYNGEKDEWYVDRYLKEENSVVRPVSAVTSDALPLPTQPTASTPTASPSPYPYPFSSH